MAFQLSWHHTSDAASPHRGYRKLQHSDSLTIGRETGVDILLKDAAVSRLHAEIWVDGQGVHVKDRGSSNGIKLDGRRITEAGWLPGQKLQVGPFIVELAPQAAGQQPAMMDVPSRLNPMGGAGPQPTRMGEPFQSPGRIKLGEVYRRAIRNDKNSVRDMFNGFLGRNEQVIDCGYLGSLGIFFPTHSFWCVTDARVCGMMVNYAGWVNFQFGFIKALNRASFNQPSLIGLWLTLIFWFLFAIVMLVQSIYLLINFAMFVGILGLLATTGIVALTPVVVWLYHRYEKAGCVFWTVEDEPIWIFSDRHSIVSSQRFMSIFNDQKRLLGD
jgi:FHA domain